MRVKSITFAGKADVFNMEVDDTHDFAVNEDGAIVHNCFDELKYCLMERMISPRANAGDPEYDPRAGLDPLDQKKIRRYGALM